MNIKTTMNYSQAMAKSKALEGRYPATNREGREARKAFAKECRTDVISEHSQLLAASRAVPTTEVLGERPGRGLDG